MAILLESEIIKSKPIGEGLAAFRDVFRSTCADLGVPGSADGVQQIDKEGDINQSCDRVLSNVHSASKPCDRSSRCNTKPSCCANSAF
jgi:hypothetical protein